MRYRKGITLIELVVTMAITVMLIGIVTQALITNIRFFHKSSFENDSQLASYNIYQNLKNELTLEGNKEVRLYNAMPLEADYKVNHSYVYVEDGFVKVIKTNEDMEKPGTVGTVQSTYDLTQYGGDEFDIVFTTTADNPNIINVQVTVDGGVYGEYKYENMIILRKNSYVIFNLDPTDPEYDVSKVDSNIVTQGNVLVVEDVKSKVVIE